MKALDMEEKWDKLRNGNGIGGVNANAGSGRGMEEKAGNMHVVEYEVWGEGSTRVKKGRKRKERNVTCKRI